jgi:hypothetical protein
VTRVIVELVEDIRFEGGTWVPTDERTRALVDGISATCSAPRRVFSRAAAALDVERVSLREAARRAGEDPALPDLNLFYVVEGDAEALRALPLVAQVVEVPADPAPAPLEGVRGRRVEHAPGALLADEIDHAAASLAAGDTLVVPYPLGDPASRAAAVVAARRGVRVVGVEGELRAGPPLRAGKARATVTLDRVTLVTGGDRGDSEIYVEGWIDDGVRRPVRVPEQGARPGVRRGLPQDFGVQLYDGVPEETLVVHLEVWEEDLGRGSLVDPDDLLGVHERSFTAAERWGEGRHADVPVETEDGACLLTYTIDLVPR